MATPFAFQTGATNTTNTPNNNFTLSTTFEKLPANVQQQLLQIHENKKISEQLKSILAELDKSGKGTSDSGYNREEIGNDLDLLKVRTISSCIDAYKGEGDSIDQQFQLLIHHAESASMIAKTIDQIQKQPGARYPDYAEAPSQYFYDLLVSIQKRMQQFRQILSNLEAILISPVQSRAYTPQMLVDAAKNQHLAFMLSALQVGDIHNKVEELKTKYLALQRSRGDNVDPFEKAPQKKFAAFQPQQLSNISSNFHVNDSVAMAQMQQQQPQPGQPQASTGFGFGFSSAAPSSSFSFGSTPSTGFGFSSGASTGFAFGGGSSSASGSTGFSFGSSTGASTGFGFGGGASTGASTGFGFGASAGAGAGGTSTGFGFGGGASTGASTGFGFGGSTSSGGASTGFSFGGGGGGGGASTGFAFGGGGGASTGFSFGGR